MQDEKVAGSSGFVNTDPDPEAEIFRPEIIQEERAILKRRIAAPPTLFQLALRGANDPEEIARRLETFLESFDKVWLRRIQPEWMVEFEGMEGERVYRPTFAAALQAAKVYGISVESFRPMHDHGVHRGNPNPLRTVLDSGAVMYELWATGFVGITGEEIPPVRAARHSNEKFIGRATKKRDRIVDGETVEGERVDPDAAEMDLVSSVITLAMKKVYLIGAGKILITRSQLESMLAPEQRESWFRRVRKGAGHGKAQDREEGRSTDADQPATEPMAKRTWALFIEWGTAHKVGEARTKAYLRECLKELGVENLTEKEVDIDGKKKKLPGLSRAQMRTLWARVESETKAAKEGHPVAGVAEGKVASVAS